VSRRTSWILGGLGCGLTLQQANDLPTQGGGYIHEVVSGGPADRAGLQGSSGTMQLDRLDVPVGGDVVIAADGESVVDWSDLLARIALSDVGEQVELAVLRDGEEMTISVELEAQAGTQ
jgi:serine protease Do